MFILGFFILFYTEAIHGKTLMGFEVEVQHLKLKEQSYPHDPLVERNNWRLFTDMWEEDGYTLEFATKSGYDRNDIIKATEEIEETIMYIKSRIVTNAGLIKVLPSYKNWSKNRFDKLAEYKNILQSYLMVCKGSSAIDPIYLDCIHNFFRKLEEEYLLNPKLDVLDKLFNSILPKIAETTEDLKNELQIEIKKEELDEQLIADLREMIVNESADILDQVIFGYISDVNSDIKPEEMKIDPSYAEQFLLEGNQQESTATTLRKGIIEAIIDNPDQVSAIFEVGDEYLKNIRDFQVYYNFNLIRNPARMILNLYEPSGIIGVQLTYQTPLISVKSIFEHYSGQVETLNQKLGSGLNISHNMRFLPDDLVKHSFFLLTGNYVQDIYKSHSKYYSQDITNRYFSDLWNPQRQKVLSKKWKNINFRKKLKGQAEGLFFLFLSYAALLFNRPSSHKELDSIEEALIYGPKILLPLMSRISFSEMYAGMERNEREAFVKMVSVFCGRPIQTNILIHVKLNKSNIYSCETLYLSKYIIMEGFGDELNGETLKDLTIFDWAQSIVNSDQNSKNKQPKIIMQTGESDETNTKIKNRSSDLLSPPPGYTRRYDDSDPYNDVASIDTYKHKAIYSMGAYSGIDKGDTLLEFRDFANSSMNEKDLLRFIKTEGMKLFDVIQGQQNGEYYSEIPTNYSENINEMLDQSGARYFYNKNNYILV